MNQKRIPKPIAIPSITLIICHRKWRNKNKQRKPLEREWPRKTTNKTKAEESEPGWEEGTHSGGGGGGGGGIGGRRISGERGWAALWVLVSCFHPALKLALCRQVADPVFHSPLLATSATSTWLIHSLIFAIPGSHRAFYCPFLPTPLRGSFTKLAACFDFGFCFGLIAKPFKFAACRGSFHLWIVILLQLIDASRLRSY